MASQSGWLSLWYWTDPNETTRAEKLIAWYSQVTREKRLSEEKGELYVYIDYFDDSYRRKVDTEQRLKKYCGDCDDPLVKSIPQIHITKVELPQTAIVPTLAVFTAWLLVGKLRPTRKECESAKGATKDAAAND